MIVLVAAAAALATILFVRCALSWVDWFGERHRQRASSKFDRDIALERERQVYVRAAELELQAAESRARDERVGVVDLVAGSPEYRAAWRRYNQRAELFPGGSFARQASPETRAWVDRARAQVARAKRR